MSRRRAPSSPLSQCCCGRADVKVTKRGSRRRLFIFRALALGIAVQCLFVGASVHTAPASAAQTALVFKIEGSQHDPEFVRACGVVKSLEDLYGRERYRLQQVYTGALGRRRKGLRWIPSWFRLGRGRSMTTPSRHSTVLCSISRTHISGGDPKDHGELLVAGSPATENGLIDPSIAIGGVDDLMDFVRDSVLAGPRPFSFGFHEKSLRIKGARRSENGGTVTSARPSRKSHTPSTMRVPISTHNNSVANIDESQSLPDASEHEFDLVVIGGGSGGLACAKEAANLGQKVACLDFVKPSAMGSVWGLGGTCVNVGCIPKKLMHQASLLAGHVEDASFFGWQEGSANSSPNKGHGGDESDWHHDWSSMVQRVQNHIKGLNFKYRADLRSKGVEYVNARGTLQDAHHVLATDRRGKERVLSCSKIVVAVGGRPKMLSCEGGELAMTSDDIFALKTPPGKTLIVGASYVALECAGFLTGLNVDTTVMVRSILLRGFDQGIAERIGSFMEAEGTRFLRPSSPHRITKTEGGRLLVEWREGTAQARREEVFDTVLAATGRKADVEELGLENLGVALSDEGKMICNNEETSVPGIFGIGDAVHGVPELTPSAIQAGRLLARRLFGGSAEAMDYSNVCTTVFTPLEYGCCGLSEEDAIQNLGEENVEVYHTAFTPLEWQLNPERPQNACYVKAVCDLSDRKLVLGLHFLGPNAGEVMQGFGLGMRLGMTYKDLRQLVGIHPTVAEEITLLQTTKRSGDPIEKSGC